MAQRFEDLLGPEVLAKVEARTAELADECSEKAMSKFRKPLEKYVPDPLSAYVLTVMARAEGEDAYGNFVTKRSRGKVNDPNGITGGFFAQLVISSETQLVRIKERLEVVEDPGFDMPQIVELEENGHAIVSPGGMYTTDIEFVKLHYGASMIDGFLYPDGRQLTLRNSYVKMIVGHSGELWINPDYIRHGAA